MTAKPKRYATIHNPTIQAILSEMYRYASVSDALQQLHVLRRHYIVAKKQIENTAHPSLILWVKGYALTDAEREEGMMGHYAVISFKPVEGKTTLFATKMDVPLRDHPQRALIMRNNPNWGHPVLRALRKGKTYGTPEEAQADLSLLHEHYPSVSIPNPGKLYIMIYCSSRTARERMVKHTLEIVYDEEKEGYRIDCKENIAKKALPGKPVKKPAEPPQGAFTAKVALSRQRRGKKPKPTSAG